MTTALAKSPTSRPRLRLAGRSFLAFVLEPVPPLGDWLTDLDDVAKQSAGFFANRPVVLDLTTLAPDRAETETLLAGLKARSIRVIAVEGVDPSFAPDLAPLATGKESARVIEFPRAPESNGRDAVDDTPAKREAPVAPSSSLIIDKPIRSGQTIFHPDGDLVIIGSVSSGAEVIAGGSIHVYGRLCGRAIAGATGNAHARIFARRFEAELVAIDGCYQAAAESAPQYVGKPVRIRLRGDAIVTELVD